MIAAIFGILAFIWPGLTLFVLVLLFGIYAPADGLLALWLAFTAARERRRWWPFILEGLVGVAAGIMTVVSVQHPRLRAWPRVRSAVRSGLVGCSRVKSQALARR